jgi:hypothetical protein
VMVAARVRTLTRSKAFITFPFFRRVKIVF